MGVHLPLWTLPNIHQGSKLGYQFIWDLPIRPSFFPAWKLTAPRQTLAQPGPDFVWAEFVFEKGLQSL